MPVENTDSILFDTLFKNFRDLPSPPVLVLEILSSIQNANVNIGTLVDEISGDQAIAARLLRVANSPFYGFPGHIGSVRESVSVLGFDHVGGLVAAAALVGHFPRPETGGFDWLDFWQHGVRVGNAARVLAPHAHVNGEIAFTAGLLHDVGRLVLGVCAHDRFEEVERRREDFAGDRAATERAVLGMDHAAIGAEVARRWNFPVNVCAAIHSHHDPQRLPDQPLNDIIYLANLLAHEIETTEEGAQIAASPHFVREAWSRLLLEAEAVPQIMTRVMERDAASRLLIDG